MNVKIKKRTRIRPDVNKSKQKGILEIGAEVEVEDKLYLGKYYTHEKSGFSSSFWFKDIQTSSEKYYWEGCNVDLDALEKGNLSLLDRFKDHPLDKHKHFYQKLLKKEAAVKIAIIDSGFDLLHPAFSNLRNNIVEWYDYNVSDNGTRGAFEKLKDSGNHGTACLSVLGGFNTINPRIEGIAPEASYYLFKVTDEGSSSVNANYLFKAFQKALDLNVNIISCSLGFHMEHDEKEYLKLLDKGIEDDIFEKARSKGILIFCAANRFDANLFKHLKIYPAASEKVISVGAYHEPFFQESSNSNIMTLSDNLNYVIPSMHNIIVCNAQKGANISEKYITRILTSSFATPILAGLTAKLIKTNPYNPLQKLAPVLPFNSITDFCSQFYPFIFEPSQPI